QKKVAKQTVSKLVVVNFSGDRNFEKAMAKLGVMDVLDPNLNYRALKFKLDFWMKSLTAQLKKLESLPGASATKNSADKSKGLDKKLPELQINWTPALECEDDIWLTKSDADCKKVLSKFLVKFMAPSPYTGQWIEDPKKD